MQNNPRNFDLITACLARLEHINVKGYNAFKTAWLASKSENRLYPSLRTVVIRAYLKPNVLEIYTDSRSQKWIDLVENPYTELGFYDAEQKFQLRAKATVELITGTTYAINARDKLSADQLKNYTTEDAPGSELNHELGFTDTAYFGIIKATMVELDCLQLLANNQSLRTKAVWNLTSQRFDSHNVVP